MRDILPLLLIMLLVCCGCSSLPGTVSETNQSAATAQITRRVDEIFDSVQKKDFPRLDSYHLYGPRFTKFSPSGLGREDAEASRSGEHAGLAAATVVSMKADDLKIDRFGDAAIATFILSYSVKTPDTIIDKKVRTTMVFARHYGTWKIVHEHLSPFTPKS
jgi:ketosteroid isomerase-like protein